MKNASTLADIAIQPMCAWSFGNLTQSYLLIIWNFIFITWNARCKKIGLLEWDSFPFCHIRALSQPKTRQWAANLADFNQAGHIRWICTTLQLLRLNRSKRQIWGCNWVLLRLLTGQICIGPECLLSEEQRGRRHNLEYWDRPSPTYLRPLFITEGGKGISNIKSWVIYHWHLCFTPAMGKQKGFLLVQSS